MPSGSRDPKVSESPWHARRPYTCTRLRSARFGRVCSSGPSPTAVAAPETSSRVTNVLHSCEFQLKRVSPRVRHGPTPFAKAPAPRIEGQEHGLHERARDATREIRTRFRAVAAGTVPWNVDC